jgi:hypothetical protein
MNTPATAKVLPPIYRQIRQLVLLLEQAVMRFGRYHKYGVGADLRQQAMACWRCVHRACHGGRSAQAQHVHALAAAVDELKLTLQLAHAVGAFANAKVFEQAVALVVSVGKQCGGWQRELGRHNTPARGPQAHAPAPGPNAQASPVQRPTSLSAQPACAQPQPGGQA